MDPKDGGRFAIASYLDHHADKLVRRFDANSTIALTQAMSLFDRGRDRGGVELNSGTEQPCTESQHKLGHGRPDLASKQAPST